MSAKVAIITDVHGNCTVLNAVLNDIDSRPQVPHGYILREYQDGEMDRLAMLLASEGWANDDKLNWPYTPNDWIKPSSRL